ncbi:MAG: radical SAM protein [Caulobacteraceae bacterium]
MRAQAAADGITDAVVFNTCAVTGEAVRQARQAIRKARRERPGARLVVTGCAAQIDPASFSAMPEVDLVLGNAEKSAPGALGTAARVQVSDIMQLRESPSRPVGGLTERARAYVEVQNGCDHRCTFCIIPFGRGNSRSIPAERVVDEVRGLARAGYAEVVLTGVDLTSWGAELPPLKTGAAPTLGFAGRAHPGRGPRTAAPAAVLDRRRRDRRRADGLPGERTAALPAPAPVAAIGRRSDPQADEAQAFVRRRPVADRRRAPHTARHRVRRRLHRRFPTETDASFKNTLAFCRSRQPCLPARVSLQPPPRHAGRADAAGGARCGQASRRASAVGGRRGADPPPRQPGRSPCRGAG